MMPGSKRGEREEELRQENEVLTVRLDKTELELVVAREQAAAVQDKSRALEAEVKRVEERARDAEQAVDEAKAAQDRAARQLSEALESITDAGLEKVELERRARDLEAGFEAVKEERAGAEERWNATDEERLGRIRELERQLERVQGDFDKTRQNFEEQRTADQQEKETLEQAWKEATELRVALASAREEATQKIEVLERQQEEFIAKLVNDYDEQLATAVAELEKLREKESDEASLNLALAERDSALAELESARVEAGKVAALQSELDALRSKAPSTEEASLRATLERTQADLDASRSVVDQLLLDCDQLHAENSRLKEDVKQPRSSFVPFEPQESATSDAMALAESRASSVPASDPTPKRSCAPSSERPAGSYSLIADDLSSESTRTKPRRRK